MKQNLQPSFHIIATFSKQINFVHQQKYSNKCVILKQFWSSQFVLAHVCQYILLEDNNDGFIMW